MDLTLIMPQLRPESLLILILGRLIVCVVAYVTQ